MRVIENKHVVVTGGAGFIGSNLCEALLKQGNKVICLDNFLTSSVNNVEEFLANENFRLIEGDIRDLETCKLACEGVDIVLHQAALGSVPRSIDDPVTTNDINVNGTLNLLLAAKETGVSRVVYAASSSTYGNDQTMPKVEDSVGRQLSPYAVSKYVNELYANVFADLYGLEVIGLRYFNVFGRRQSPEGAYAAAIPKFIKAMLSGDAPVLHGDGEQTRDFTHVSNVVQANNLAATTNNKLALNTVFNVAFGKRTSINELFSVLQEVLTSIEPRVQSITPKYTEVRTGDVKHSHASIEKAQTLLDYNPETDLKTGLHEAIQWYVDHLSVVK